MITKISLRNFRKFDSFTISINSKFVVIEGDNATGKTTILEAISLISTTKSHRSSDLKELIKKNTKFADATITSSSVFKIIISEEGKTILINNKEIPKLSQYIGSFLSIYFSLNDFSLIHGSPIIKRRFINQELSQIDSFYLKSLANFQILINERNNYLRSAEFFSKLDLKYLDVLNKKLIDIQIEILNKRINFINMINEKLLEFYKNLNIDEIVQIKYIKSLPDDNILEFYNSKLQYDFNLRKTNYGIHRDQIVFMLNNKKAAGYASQGQMKTAILALKIVLCKIIKQVKDKYPILLIDDIMSELDEKRQLLLLNQIKDYEQVFITVTDFKLIKFKLPVQYQKITLLKE